jgi:hypothetical protein
MVGPKSPRGLIANGRSCAFESKSWPMITSPERVMPTLRAQDPYPRTPNQ